MNFRTTFILLIVMAAALVFVFVVERRGPGEQNADNASDSLRGKKLIDEKTDDVRRLTIRSGNGSAKPLELARQDGRWKLIQPIDWAADDFEARGLVDAIVDLRSQGGVELNDANLASTGLDHPRFTVELTDTGGKTVDLDIGARSTLGNDLYVKLAGDKGGQLVAGSSLSDKLDKGLDKLADSIRDKQLVKVTTTEMRQVEIDRRGNKLELQKEGEDWKIVEPRKEPADSAEVSDLLSAVTGLRADEFIDPHSPDVIDAQFDRPKAVVFFSTTQPSTQPSAGPATRPAGVTVTFGQFSSVDRDKLYVKLSDPDIVAKVSMTQSQLDKLTDASVLSLRDKKVIDVDPAQVERFVLTINHAATTQPTTKPAELHEYTIARRNEAEPLGPPLPPAPATQAGSTTRPAMATTQPATSPSLAATQPAAPRSKWVFQSGGSGDADDTQVEALLTALHPLRADKYIEKAPTTQPAGTYTLVVYVGPANGHGPQHYVLRLTSPGATGAAIGGYQDLTFETDRSILDKLDANFKGSK